MGVRVGCGSRDHAGRDQLVERWMPCVVVRNGDDLVGEGFRDSFRSEITGEFSVVLIVVQPCIEPEHASAAVKSEFSPRLQDALTSGDKYQRAGAITVGFDYGIQRVLLDEIGERQTLAYGTARTLELEPFDPGSRFQDLCQGVAQAGADLTGDADFMPSVRSRDGPARTGRLTHRFRDDHAAVGNPEEETTHCDR